MFAITNASARPLSQSATSAPNMADVLAGWLQPIILGRSTTTIDEETGRSVEVIRDQQASGVVQPFKDKDLLILPEGLRGFSWFTLHVYASTPVRINDVVTRIRDSQKFRVMSQRNNSEYGFEVYNLQADFKR